VEEGADFRSMRGGNQMLFCRRNERLVDVAKTRCGRLSAFSESKTLTWSPKRQNSDEKHRSVAIP
jgi:hypothetical protein